MRAGVSYPFVSQDGRRAGVIVDGVLTLTDKKKPAHFIHSPEDSIGIDKMAFDARESDIHTIICPASCRSKVYSISVVEFIMHRRTPRSHHDYGPQYHIPTRYWRVEGVDDTGTLFSEAGL
jgi:hypothetical protein